VYFRGNSGVPGETGCKRTQRRRRERITTKEVERLRAKGRWKNVELTERNKDRQARKKTEN
jgi:hypothetical protein